MVEEVKEDICILRVAPQQEIKPLLPTVPDAVPRFQASDFDVYNTFMKTQPHFFKKWASLTLGFNYESGRKLTVTDYTDPSQRQNIRTNGSNDHYINLKMALYYEAYNEEFGIKGLCRGARQLFSNQALEMTRIMVAKNEPVYNLIEKKRNIMFTGKRKTIWVVENFSPLFVMHELLLTTNKKKYLAKTLEVVQQNTDYNNNVVIPHNTLVESVLELASWSDFVTIGSPKQRYGFPYPGYKKVHRKNDCMGALKSIYQIDGDLQEYKCEQCNQLLASTSGVVFYEHIRKKEITQE